MKILIISSSLNPDSHSYKLCREVEKFLQLQGEIEIAFIDLRQKSLALCHQPKTPDMEEIEQRVEWADHVIFGMAVYNYSVNDSLKAVLDTCFPGKENALFGIVCAAGGEKSYLATMHLMQICMKEWRMIPLPRIVYATSKDFENHLPKAETAERIKVFVGDFYRIGKKLLVAG